MSKQRSATSQSVPMMLRAMFDSQTVNSEKREIEVVFATDAPVRTYMWGAGGYVNEILSFDEGHIRWERLNSGAPVLDNHNRWGSIEDTQVALVVRAWKDSEGKGRALLRFDDEGKSDRIWKKVEKGQYRNISVGYNVYSYQVTERDGELPEYRAIDWEPFEVSLVPVPADINSGVRSDDDKPKHDVKLFFNSNNRKMNKEQLMAEISRLRGLASPSEADTQKLRQYEAELAALEGKRSANPTPAPANPTPAPAPSAAPTPAPAAGEEGVRAIADAAVRAERERTAGILSAVRAAKLGDEFAQGLIDQGVSVDKAREMIIQEWAKNSPVAPQGANRSAGPEVGADGADKRRAAMTDALMLRAGHAIEKPADGAADFRGMSLLRMAEESLIANGVSARGMSSRELAQAAMGLTRGYHSSSDFPIILGNAVNRVLRQAYALQPRTFLPFTRRTSASDFREMTKAQISGLVKGFEKVNEGGEYKYNTMKEAKESYKVEKFGTIIAVTWETLINDDLDAFNRIPTAIAQKAAQKQSDIVWNILLNNPTMGDDVVLFHADHANLGSASAINEAGLNAARKAMRLQKSLEGDFINVQPRYMLVGADKETEAQKLLQATIIATKAADTNIFRGFTELIVEPRITGNKWFLVADPSAIDTIEYAFLEGDGELFTEQREGFEVDGLEIKARMVFGAKAIDHRGLYYNPGA